MADAKQLNLDDVLWPAESGSHLKSSISSVMMRILTHLEANLCFAENASEHETEN
jgi:hypothetical protein